MISSLFNLDKTYLRENTISHYKYPMGVNVFKTEFIPITYLNLDMMYYDGELKSDTVYLKGSQEGYISTGNVRRMFETMDWVRPIVNNNEAFFAPKLYIKSEVIHFTIIIRSSYVIDMFKGCYDFILNESKFYKHIKDHPSKDEYIRYLKCEWIRNNYMNQNEILKHCFLIDKYSYQHDSITERLPKIEEPDDILLENIFVTKKIPTFRELDEPENIVNNILEAA